MGAKVKNGELDTININIKNNVKRGRGRPKKINNIIDDDNISTTSTKSTKSTKSNIEPVIDTIEAVEPVIDTI